MTPWHLGERAQGYGEEIAAQYRRTLYGAWHAAALQRIDAKKFPPLEKLLAPSKKAEPKPAVVDEQALWVAFQKHNDRVKQKNGEAR